MGHGGEVEGGNERQKVPGSDEADGDEAQDLGGGEPQASPGTPGGRPHEQGPQEEAQAGDFRWREILSPADQDGPGGEAAGRRHGLDDSRPSLARHGGGS